MSRICRARCPCTVPPPPTRSPPPCRADPQSRERGRRWENTRPNRLSSFAWSPGNTEVREGFFYEMCWNQPTNICLTLNFFAITRRPESSHIWFPNLPLDSTLIRLVQPGKCCVGAKLYIKQPTRKRRIQVDKTFASGGIATVQKDPSVLNILFSKKRHKIFIQSCSRVKEY